MRTFLQDVKFPRSNCDLPYHTYLVESYFAAGQTSLRSKIHGRYQKFIQKLMKSPSKEIRFLCNVLVNDPRSTIGQNVWYLNRITNSSKENTKMNFQNIISPSLSIYIYLFIMLVQLQLRKLLMDYLEVVMCTSLSHLNHIIIINLFQECRLHSSHSMREVLNLMQG